MKEDFKIRCNVGKCWMSLIKHNKDIFHNFFEKSINFFTCNLTVDNYEMNMIAGEFFFKIIDEDGEEEPYIRNEIISEMYKSNLPK
jgi:hypothetical protein